MANYDQHSLDGSRAHLPPSSRTPPGALALMPPSTWDAEPLDGPLRCGDGTCRRDPAPSALGLHQRLQRRHPFHDRCADSMEARADAMSSRLIAGAPTTPGLLTDKLLDVAL